MSGLLSIETFTAGASCITCIYHFTLYLQQKDRFLLLYALYLLSLTLFMFFRIYTRYDPFSNPDSTVGFALDELLQLLMYMSYVVFITTALEINEETRFVQVLTHLFLVVASLLIGIHIFKYFAGSSHRMGLDYFIFTRGLLLMIAFCGLSGAWYSRRSVFHRILLAGGIVYAIASLLTIISIGAQRLLFGIEGMQFYYIGCLADVVIFSSALGYRFYLISVERSAAQQLLLLESEKNKSLLQARNELLVRDNEAAMIQQKMNKELQDMIGASLSSIHVFSDVALQSMAAQPDKVNEYLDRISTSSKQLMDDIGDMIWSVNTTPSRAAEALLERIKNYGMEILHPKQVLAKSTPTTAFRSSQFSSEQIRNAVSEAKAAMRKLIEDKAVKAVEITLSLVDQKPTVSIHHHYI